MTMPYTATHPTHLHARLKWALLLLLTPLLGTLPVRAQEPALTVAVSPSPIGIDQETLLQIRVEVAAMRLLRVQPAFEIENLEIVAGPFQEQSMQFVNGSISNSTTLRWRLRPTAIGEAKVHAIAVEVGDQRLTAEDLTLMVQEESVPLAGSPQHRQDPLEEFFQRGRDPFRPRAAARPELYLRVETNPGDPFVGEPVHYTLYLFTRNDVTAVNAEELPDFEGFWKEEPAGNDEPKNAQTVTIDGQQWLRVALLERVLYPLRAGELPIAPATMAFTVDLDRSGFFRDRRSVRRQSPETTLAVRPLPAGGPGRAVPVGRVNLTSSLEPARVEAGEAAQLKIMAQSTGNLRRLADPAIEAPTGVEIYPPQGEIDRLFTPSGVEFTRTWSWVVVPQMAGEFPLPAVEIPYFDLQSETFQTANVDAVTLSVIPATVPLGSTLGGGHSAGGLHPVRMASVAALEGSRRPDWSNWLLVAGLVGTFLIAVNDLRARPAASSPPTRSAGRGGTRRDLLAAIAAIDNDDPRRAAAELEREMRSYLVNRWGLDDGAPFDDWANRLKDSGIPETTLERLKRITADLHYLRYAPQLSQRGHLVDDVRNAAIEWARRMPRR